MEFLKINESFTEIFNREFHYAQTLTFYLIPKKFKDELLVRFYIEIMPDIDAIKSTILKMNYQSMSKHVVVRFSDARTFFRKFDEAWKKTIDATLVYIDDNFKEALKYRFEEVFKRDGIKLLIDESYEGNLIGRKPSKQDLQAVGK